MTDHNSESQINVVLTPIVNSYWMLIVRAISLAYLICSNFETSTKIMIAQEILYFDLVHKVGGNQQDLQYHVQPDSELNKLDFLNKKSSTKFKKENYKDVDISSCYVVGNKIENVILGTYSRFSEKTIIEECERLTKEEGYEYNLLCKNCFSRIESAIGVVIPVHFFQNFTIILSLIFCCLFSDTLLAFFFCCMMILFRKQPFLLPNVAGYYSDLNKNL
eukprot:gene3344-5891_t